MRGELLCICIPITIHVVRKEGNVNKEEKENVSMNECQEKGKLQDELVSMYRCLKIDRRKERKKQRKRGHESRMI